MRKALHPSLPAPAGVLAVLALLVPACARAADYYYGCFNCVASGYGETYCAQVGDNETGEGWECKEETLWGGTACTTNHEACYNIVVDGGGDTTGGDSGGECNVGAGGYCPPSCGSCNRTP